MNKSITDLKKDMTLQLSEIQRTYLEIVSKLENLAYIDELTHILNRRGILNSLDAQLANAERQSEFVLVMMMDLNKFKMVNDTLGHDAGDLLLQQVATRLTSVFRKGDKVGRLGGDEFMVVCESNRAEDGAEIVTAKVLETFKQPFKGFEDFDVSNSIGVSIYPKHGTNQSVLMKKADIAMYIAKESGSGYHIYNQDKDKERIIR